MSLAERESGKRRLLAGMAKVQRLAETAATEKQNCWIRFAVQVRGGTVVRVQVNSEEEIQDPDYPNGVD